MKSLLPFALDYASRYGWAVHPVNRKKMPTTEHGRDDATRDEATIQHYFRNGAQLGVATGPESRLFVLDVDVKPEKGIDGRIALAALEAQHGPLPHTPRQRTGSGGEQYLFRYVDGLKNSQSKLGPGLDTRGQGGYIVVAPSSNTKGVYAWIVSPDDVPLADVPQWLIALLTAEPERPAPRPAAPILRDLDPYLDRAFRNEIANVATAPDGTKHEILRDAAIKLGTLIAHGLDAHAIEDALFNAISGRADNPENALRTIQAGIAYGAARPRTIPNRQQPTRSTDSVADDTTPDTRPTIDISTIDLPTVMPHAWDAISAANDPPTIFRRAGELARLETTESGALMIRTVDTRRMAGILARAARWVRVSYGRRGDATEKETIPPAAVVDDAMVNVDPRIPILTRIVHAPAFAEGDLLLAEPGYHAAARIYYDPKHGAVVPAVPAVPTESDLAQAKALILDDLLIDFPFVSDADRAHAVALFLLPFVRELISGPTPLHLIEAPTMGTGKGLLAETLLLPALGETPTVMTEATTDEEWGKQITSNLLMAPAAIYIDNLNRMLASGKLAAALTAREYSDRVLGSSEQVSLPVRCVWVATGNNPTLSTEISRRCIRIRIDPRIDEPWKRDGFKHAKLRSWVEAKRGDLVWAALIVCRYGMQHGAPGPALGSYEAWSDVLGRILAGAGIPGFLGNLDVLYARADAEGAAWRALISAWWEQYQSTSKAAGDLFPLVAEVEADTLVNGRDDVGRKKSFGKALARVLERVFTVETDAGPLRLQVAEDGVRHKARLWKLAPVEKGGIGGLGGLFQPHARKSNFLDGGIVKNPPNPQYPPAEPEYRDIGRINARTRVLLPDDGEAIGFDEALQDDAPVTFDGPYEEF